MNTYVFRHATYCVCVCLGVAVHVLDVLRVILFYFVQLNSMQNTRLSSLDVISLTATNTHT